jgi:hypothetical protein
MGDEDTLWKWDSSGEEREGILREGRADIVGRQEGN